MKKFKKCFTKKDLMNDPRLTDGVEWCMFDNHWEGFLKTGYQAYGNQQHNIFEPTIKDFCRVMNTDVDTWDDDPDFD
jgi:hypothetical protein